jgi:hypothetical protein
MLCTEGCQLFLFSCFRYRRCILPDTDTATEPVTNWAYEGRGSGLHYVGTACWNNPVTLDLTKQDIIIQICRPTRISVFLSSHNIYIYIL